MANWSSSVMVSATTPSALSSEAILCLFLKKVDTLTLKCVTLTPFAVCNVSFPKKVDTLTLECVTFVTFVSFSSCALRCFDD